MVNFSFHQKVRLPTLRSVGSRLLQITYPLLQVFFLGQQFVLNTNSARKRSKTIVRRYYFRSRSDRRGEYEFWGGRACFLTYLWFIIVNSFIRFWLLRSSSSRSWWRLANSWSILIISLCYWGNKTAVRKAKVRKWHWGVESFGALWGHDMDRRVPYISESLLESLLSAWMI